MTRFYRYTYYIFTMGCSANLVDSARIEAVLEALGLEKTFEIEKADLVIINSCSVRQKSEDKVYGFVQKFESPESRPTVILTGCMVGSAAGERRRYELSQLKKRTPWVDEYLLPENLIELPSILEKRGLIDRTSDNFCAADLGFHSISGNGNAYVNISTGCDNFCSYCVVPYARGPEISRDEKDILKEILGLTEQGVSKVTLCGQNVNSWGLDGSEKFDIRAGSDHKLPFANLLRKVNNIAGIEEIEFISSNPFDFTKDLVEAVQLPKISEYLHIAVQSGNNDILRSMNRRHTIEEFLTLVENIQKAKPCVRLGTDIIVGFPGETREQFMDSVKLFRQVQFKVAYISMYSPRQGTMADKVLTDNVSLDEKKYRHAYLTEVWKESLRE